MSGKMFRNLGSLILVILIAVSISVSAQPITAPAIIKSPGQYELTTDARGITDVYGIKIESSDVVLDGQGHFLGGDQRDKSIGVYVNKYGDSITNVSIKNLKLEDWNSAISYQYVKGTEGDVNEMSNLDIVECPTGIHVEYSDVITLTDNLIRDCSKAINIEQNSNKVSLIKNILKNNGVGVIVMKTTDTTLSENNINSCDVYGIQVSDSSGLTLTKNSVSDNKYAALLLENSEDSTIADNNFSKTGTGPVVVIGNGVRGAKIVNNYFGSVTNVSVDDISSDIVWNTTLETGVNILGGPYLGGNYWGSAPGLSGFSDEVADDDGFGIGDKPFEINAYNIDYLPLTNTDKNYPAPTPTPEEPVIIESEGEILSDSNMTEPVEGGNTTNTTEIVESEEQAEIPVVNETGLNTSENVTQEEPATSPSISVQNEHAEEGSVFAALGSPVVQVKDEKGELIENATAQNETNATPVQVKNGYLLFTGLTPGNQVVLITAVNTEVVLDLVQTSSLSVPVPSDIPLYASWRLVNQNQTVASGSIDRYPAADETVVITVTPDVMQSSGDNASIPSPVIPVQPSILTMSNLTGVPTPSTGNESVMNESNNTPFLVVPPVLSYLPAPQADVNSSSSESVVMMNTADGNFTPGYTVTAYAGPGGAIFPEGSVDVMAEENVTFVLTPYDGYKIDYLLIDGSNVEPTPEYQFTNITRDHTIIVGFA